MRRLAPLDASHRESGRSDSEGAVGVAIAGLDNEDGSWRGTLYGYMSPNESSDNLVLLTGDGAYEGLSAMMFMRCNSTDCDVHAMVFPGELPPLPEMQEPPAG